ncbi:hypothetical protein [Streptomyces glomeratus]|uniref:Small hydrophilic protein n=1 Tax=Streptomyces glomeratus TaxID=284452 RepID=A0ABP6LA12_9ACTN|nr:hypothetical protein [Streptomyces glomeratus]MCF1508354.1 hypothetical protein [Streptomyces glomeratus]
MAKNKNRKQAGPQNRSSKAEQAHEQGQRSSETHESPIAQVQGSPTEVARKKKQSFGHN